MPSLEIQSHKGPYRVEFISDLKACLEAQPEDCHFIIDRKVFELYSDLLAPFEKKHSILLFDASEENKDLEKVPEVIQSLVKNKIRRNQTLVAIGGGITQDMTCFIATTLFRGISWKFFPTTLLAQADSCIGSKSSINVSGVKNLVGAFYPPQNIYIYLPFLKTLGQTELKSGVGEILKVHMIDSHESFEKVCLDYDQLFFSDETLQHYILESLRMKKKLIEIDEFDKNIRNVMNYGHSFGHAIESATKYAIPHGVAVTIGMDMANFFSFKSGLLSEKKFRHAHSTLAKNYNEFKDQKIPHDSFFENLGKDKKNENQKLGLILPFEGEPIQKRFVENNEFFKQTCLDYFNSLF